MPINNDLRIGIKVHINTSYINYLRIIDVYYTYKTKKKVLIKTCLKMILDPVKYYLLQNG